VEVCCWFGRFKYFTIITSTIIIKTLFKRQTYAVKICKNEEHGYNYKNI